MNQTGAERCMWMMNHANHDDIPSHAINSIAECVTAVRSRTNIAIWALEHDFRDRPSAPVHLWSMSRSAIGLSSTVARWSRNVWDGASRPRISCR